MQINRAVRTSKFVLMPAVMLVVALGIGKWRPELMYWNSELWGELWRWVAAWGALALVLHVATTESKRFWLLLTMGLYLSYGTGISQCATVLYAALSMYLLGRLFLFAFFVRERGGLLLVESIFTGLGCYVGIFGAMLHYPVNYAWVYFAILSVPLLVAVLLKFPQRYLPVARTSWRGTLDRLDSVTFWKFALALMVIGYVAHYAFFPSVTYDDNASHLRMAAVLAERHVFDFDARAQVWAYAPFVVDMLNAVLSVMAQENARGAMNLALLSGLLYSMWKLTRIINHAADDRLLVVALFATTPMITMLMVGLQTELMLSLLGAAAALLVLRRRTVLRSAPTAAILMIAALCCATKLPGAVFGLSLLAMFGAQFRGSRRLPTPTKGAEMQGLILVVIVGAFIALHSYVYAWYSTGNPFLPLYNAYFKSPFYPPENFIDPIYGTGATLKSFWEFFFNTTKHQESANYTAGFQYFLLLPLGAVLLIAKRQRIALRLLIPIVLFGGVMFASLQYWRYLFPVLPLASLVIGAWLASPSHQSGPRLSDDLIRASLGLFAVANLFFLPGVIWYFSTPASHAFSTAGKAELAASLVPEQHLNAELNAHAPGAKVLFEFNRPYGATLVASPTYVNWYSPEVLRKMLAVHDASDIAAMLHSEDIQYVYWDTATGAAPNNHYRTALATHLSQFGLPIEQQGSILLYRLVSSQIAYRNAVWIDDFRPYRVAAEATGATVTDSGALNVNTAPFSVRTFRTERASAVRFSADLVCPPEGGTYIAQLNWNKGAAYYRAIVCDREKLAFSEAFPVPTGATDGEIFVTRRDPGSVQVVSIRVELY